MTRGGRSGSAMLECALVFPLLALVLVGVADLGRMFFSTITALDAAYAGALYASVKSRVPDTTAVAAASRNDATELPAMSVTSTKYCTCGSSATVVSCTTACPTNAPIRLYLRVQTRQAFHAVTLHPLMASAGQVAGTAVIRVR